MSNLPPLPSSMQGVGLAPTSTGAVSEDALAKPVQLAVQLSGPKFKAREVISKAKAREREVYANKLVRDDGFTALWLANFAHGIQLDTGPLDTVLENTRALDAGEVGQLTLDATRQMKRVNQHLPQQPNAKFLKAFHEGIATAEDIYNTVRWMADQIKRALQMYDDMLAPFTAIEVQLQAKYDLMVTAVVLNEQLSQNEDARTITLTEDTALMEFAGIALPVYIQTLEDSKAGADDPAAVQKEIDRLTGLLPVITKIVMSLNPMIFTGNAAVGRYLNLSNMAGVRAVVLGLFLSAGIARWKSDVVTQLQEMNLEAVGLALDNVEQFMNQQGLNASAGYVEVASQTAELMNRWMVSAEHMAAVAGDIEKVRNILVASFRDLTVESDQVARVVQAAKTQIDQGQARFNNEMLKVSEGAA